MKSRSRGTHLCAARACPRLLRLLLGRRDNGEPERQQRGARQPEYVEERPPAKVLDDERRQHQAQQVACERMGCARVGWGVKGL